MSAISQITPILALSADDGAFWPLFFQIVLLLSAALVLGMVFERLGQSAILGYLLAGTLMGPAVLNVVSDSDVTTLAELGVALLLFAIGLEFSVRRLLQLGKMALGGGTLQVTITMAAACGVALLFGYEIRVALAIGAILALSSTACVLRMLIDRGEIDSVHGRSSLGILLLQDIAVVPLVLLVTMLVGAGTIAEMGIGFLKSIGLIVALVTGFYLLSNYVLPRLLKTLSLSRDRELLIVLAVILAMGSAGAAHALGISAALGAFIAGIMLAESPFATQIRSDVSALRALFVTLFFASVGMLGNPEWIWENFFSVALVVALIIAGKALVITIIALLFKRTVKYAVATGITLAQVGEFGVVIGGVGQKLFDQDTFQLLISAILITLFVTPYLVRFALPIGTRIESWLSKGASGLADADSKSGEQPSRANHVIVAGFGPAGQQAADELARQKKDTLVLDLRPANIELAKSKGFDAVLGDSTNLDVLLHHGIASARSIVITVPDHRDATRIAASVRNLSPGIYIIARARYHAYVEELERAGASVVIDEELVTGNRLAAAVRSVFAKSKPIPEAKTEKTGEPKETDEGETA